MKEKFNPSEYNSFEELPRGHKHKFEAIEDGKGFVLKSVEKNQEIAYRLAVAEDQAINTLKQEIETDKLSLDDLLTKYNDDDTPNFERHKLRELIREVSDYTILCGGNYDKKLKNKELDIESESYSAKTELALIEHIESTDAVTIMKLLMDNKFSRKKY